MAAAAAAQALTVEAIPSLVDKLTRNPQLVLDSKLLGDLKTLLRQSDAHVRLCYELVMRALAAPNSHIRYLALQLADYVFTQSAAFRQLASIDFSRIASLVTKKDHMLPPPHSFADVLERYALQTLNGWHEQFGPRYKQLRVGFEFLRRSYGDRWVSLVEGTRSDVATTEMVQKYRQAVSRFERARRIFDDSAAEMEVTCRQIVQFLSLLRGETEPPRPGTDANPVATAAVAAASSQASPEAHDDAVDGTQPLDPTVSEAPAADAGSPSAGERAVDLPVWERQLSDPHAPLPLLAPESAETRAVYDALRDALRTARRMHLPALRSVVSAATAVTAARPPADLLTALLPTVSGAAASAPARAAVAVAVASTSSPRLATGTVAATATGDSRSAAATGPARGRTDPFAAPRRARGTAPPSASAPASADPPLPDFSALRVGDTLERALALQRPLTALCALCDRLGLVTLLPARPEAAEAEAVFEAAVPPDPVRAAEETAAVGAAAGAARAPLSAAAPVPRPLLRSLSGGTQQPIVLEAGATKEQLLAVAPVIPAHIARSLFDNYVPQNMAGLDVSHRFMGSRLGEDSRMDASVAGINLRAAHLSDAFEPVQWCCRAPLRSGGLCQRRDREVCPLHGPVIPRDRFGNPNGSAVAVRALAASAAPTTPPVQEPGAVAPAVPPAPATVAEGGSRADDSAAPVFTPQPFSIRTHLPQQQQQLQQRSGTDAALPDPLAAAPSFRAKRLPLHPKPDAMSMLRKRLKTRRGGAGELDSADYDYRESHVNRF